MAKKKDDHTIDPGDGKNWGKGDYPPKGYHLAEVTSVETHLNFNEDDIVWDITTEPVDVGGKCLDKAGREKAASALLAAGFDEGQQVDAEDLVGCKLVVLYGDAKGATGNKLYRNALNYYPEDHEVTAESDIDFSPPPKVESEGGRRSSRRSKSDDTGTDEEEDAPKRSSARRGSRKKAAAPPA